MLCHTDFIKGGVVVAFGVRRPHGKVEKWGSAAMSALPEKADITAAQTNVRFVPKADIGSQSPRGQPLLNSSSSDYHRDRREHAAAFGAACISRIRNSRHESEGERSAVQGNRPRRQHLARSWTG